MFIALNFKFVCVYPVPYFFVVELNVYIYDASPLFWTFPVYGAAHFIPTELQTLVTPKNTILIFAIVQNQLYQALF